MNTAIDLNSVSFDCALRCFDLIDAFVGTRRESLIRLACTCGKNCLAARRSNQFGTVLPETLEHCRASCEALHDACMEMESSETVVEQCIVVCRDCAKAASQLP